MDNRIKELLEDIYIIDGTLREYESELYIIVDKFIQNYPEVKLDKSFVDNLKKELTENYKTVNNNLFFKSNIMKQFSFIAGGAALLVVLLAYGFILNVKNKEVAKQEFKLGMNIESVDPNAFGLITSAPEGGPAGGELMDAKQASGMGGGGGGLPSMLSTDAVKEDSAIANERMGILPYFPKNYKFVYSGESIDLEQKQMDVLKRIRESNNFGITGMIENFNFDAVDFNQFQNTKMQSLSFVEDKDFGYAVSLSFEDSSVSIYENWATWNMNTDRCLDEKCIQEQMLKIEDIPADEELIRMSDEFLSKYKISRDHYGVGEVDNNWRKSYDREVEKKYAYIPESISVIYPLIINGQIVYEQDGNKSGLNVMVNVRKMKVSTVYGLFAQKYESSAYGIETNIDKLLSYAETGGYSRRYSFNNEGVETVEIKIGEPQISLVKIWKYDGMQSYELLVPSLVFPIENVPEGEYVWEKNIIVPLISEMLETADSIPEPVLMRENISEPSEESLPKSEIIEVEP